MSTRLLVVLGALAVVWPSVVKSQSEPDPAVPMATRVEYQYQLHYVRPWMNYNYYNWGPWGPGLSLGGSLPAETGQSFSSLYGLPFAPPLGAGVYMNPPFSNGPPAPPVFGLGANNRSLRTDSSRNSYASESKDRHGSLASTEGLSKLKKHTETSNIKSPEMPRRRPQPSSAEARQMALELQAEGDESLRHQEWSRAYMNYRRAINVANDRGVPHTRLGLTWVALKRFPQAVREFKQGLSLDEASLDAGDGLADIFGPESVAVRDEIRRNVVAWVREDLRDSDRLFLLGCWLHLEEDPRSQEILEAALQKSNDRQPILAVLASSRAGSASSNMSPDGIQQVHFELPSLHTTPSPALLDAAEVDVLTVPPAPLPPAPDLAGR